jgi:Zn-dependent proteases
MSIFSSILARLQIILYTIPALLIAFPVHEFSHGLTAYLLGDPTAKREKRLTLNPIRHLDLFGTICLLLFGFGWAKPVPIDPRNFKNPKGGMAVTALSGPLSNLILGFLSVVLMLATYAASAGVSGIAADIVGILITFFSISAQINISLCLFNLIPLPPLDGEKIIALFLPDSAEAFLQRYGMVFQLLILFLLFSNILTGPLMTLVSNVYNNMLSIANLFFHLPIA